MKTFFGVALSALVLLAPALGVAASVNQPADQPSVIASGYGTQHPYASLDYQDGVHLRPVSPVSRSAAVVAQPRDSTLGLVNETGDGGH